MCGLAGTFGGSETHAVRQALALSMAHTMGHRGPDHQSAWADDAAPLALGHARLSIVDLSDSANQPFFSSDGRFALAYNGEIYNFIALREELESAGCTFRTHSDTEVLITACAVWGVSAAVRRFAGMFAFALWDRLERRLTLARDRVGIKPLFYGLQNGVFMFGSELKPLFKHPAFAGKLSRDSVAAYFRHCYVPAPLSIFEGIYKLPAAHILHVDSPEVWRLERYWDALAIAADGTARPVAGSLEETSRRFEALAREVVGAHLIADVPLGAFLSGGIDSTLVTALAQSQSRTPLRTFSIGFDDKRFDEAPFARQVAQHLGCDHTELYIDLAHARELVPELSYYYDEPFADSSQLPTLLLSRLTRRHVTVALSGDGGDELFAGYDRYYWMERLRRWHARLPRTLVDVAAKVPRPTLMRYLVRMLVLVGVDRNRANVRADALCHLLRMLARYDDFKYLYLTTPLSVATLRDTPLLEDEREPAGVLDDPAVREQLRDVVAWMQFVDQQTYLSDDILQKVDRASMAASLEARVPLLDHRLVEFSWSVPQAYKIKDGVGKILLRQVLYRHVPKALVDRPKHGFSVPLESWLRGPLKNWAEELLGSASSGDGLLHVQGARQLWSNLLTGQAGHTLTTVWALLMFLDWRRRTGY